MKGWGELGICFLYKDFKQTFIQPCPHTDLWRHLCFRVHSIPELAGSGAFISQPLTGSAHLVSSQLSPFCPLSGHSTTHFPSIKILLTWHVYSFPLCHFPGICGFLLCVALLLVSGHQKQVEMNWHGPCARFNEKWTHISSYFHNPSWSCYNNELTHCEQRQVPCLLWVSVFTPIEWVHWSHQTRSFLPGQAFQDLVFTWSHESHFSVFRLLRKQLCPAARRADR